MATLVFGFKLAGLQGREAIVRIWVDADGNQQLDDGEEVTPLLREGDAWFGSFEMPDGALDGTGFVVRFSAPPGSRWSLDVALDGEPPRQVYSESDRVTRSDERIIGRIRV